MHKGVGMFDSRVVTCYGSMNCFVEKGVARGKRLEAHSVSYRGQSRNSSTG